MHMDREQDEKAMGANTLAHIEAEPGSASQLLDSEAAVHRALAEQDYRAAVAWCARAYGGAIGRVCMAMVGSQAEAQELAQETFVIAYEALRTYRADGSVRAFLFGIARRVCSRHLEIRGRRDARLRLVHKGEAGEVDAAEAVALRERAMRAREALEQLRPTEREAVLLRFQGELSFREVAEACGIDEPTARKRVSRALARLRSAIGDC